MPKVKVTVEDLLQMFRHSLVMYKNKPFYIDTVYSVDSFGAFDLTTQRNCVLEGVNYEDFKAPARVLGFVNYAGLSVYLSRNPVRRYKVGLSTENTSFDVPGDYAHGHLRNDNLYRLIAPELCDTIFGRYPNITEAYKRVKGGAITLCAFDRQFAVDKRGYVYYKTRKVGTVKNPTSVYDIKFAENYQYLINCLDNNHEKSLRAA